MYKELYTSKFLLPLRPNPSSHSAYSFSRNRPGVAIHTMSKSRFSLHRDAQLYLSYIRLLSNMVRKNITGVLSLITSYEHICNKANFTCKQILPFSKSSRAPVTTQCPGLSNGPLHICDMSTNFNSFWVATGIGGPVGYTLESTTTTAGLFSFSALPDIEVLIAEKNPDF